MATLIGFDDYVSIDATDVSAYLVRCKVRHMGEEVDVTAGAGATYRERKIGLKDVTFEFTFAYDDAQQATHLPLLAVGTHALIYCPEGNTTGKPKHESSVVITEVPLEGDVQQKDMRVYTVTMAGDGVPTSNMFDGDTVT